MSFLTELEKTTNKTARTENGALSNRSTLDPLLDLFSNAGALRHDPQKAIDLFDAAYAADPTNAVRCLFYLRDIRGGQGERAIFKAIFETLSQEVQDQIVKWIPVFGRWDEVPLHENTVMLLKDQFEEDEAAMKEGKQVTLLAKWLPSRNATSKEAAHAAKLLAKAWGLKESQYRKRVSALRKYLDILESKMSANEWGQIEYGKIPAQAHRKHIGAFRRHDNERYQAYLDSVEKGEAKINAGTLFTYELYEMLLGGGGGSEKTVNAMWNALPDYTNGDNAIVLADVSGSMWGRPMAVSVSLALYFAERNKGAFKDYFMTFTDTADLVKVKGTTLSAKMRNIQGSRWGMSTNLQAAFDSILAAAKAANAPQDELPKTLYIISDMQFNQATTSNDKTNFEVAEAKFKEAGYELPHVVFWNVNARGNDAPATMHDNRVTLISGQNQSTFQYAVAGKTPVESMMDILGSERYVQIVVE